MKVTIVEADAATCFGDALCNNEACPAHGAEDDVQDPNVQEVLARVIGREPDELAPADMHAVIDELGERSALWRALLAGMLVEDVARQTDGAIRERAIAALTALRDLKSALGERW